MMKIRFYCRQCRIDKQGLSPIELAITIEGKRKFIFLPRKEQPQQFKQISSTDSTNGLTQYLNSIKQKIDEACKNALLSNQPITIELIEQHIKGKPTKKQISITELVADFLQMQKSKGCSRKVYQKYNIITNHFIKYIGGDTLCTSITSTQINVFYSQMKKIYQDSTLSVQMFRLKAMFNYGVENGYLDTNPFKVDIQRAKPKIEYLTEEELQRLRTTELHSDRLNKVRDLSVFQTGSGLSYADLANLKPNDIQTSENGIKYIYKERQKTGVFFTAVLLPCAIEVWDKYNGMLPIISNQRYNSYLKEIQTLCRIDKTLTTHIFRKTYATNLLNSGVRIDIVSQAIGHSNTRITQQAYAFLKKNTVVNEIASVLCFRDKATTYTNT